MSAPKYLTMIHSGEILLEEFIKPLEAYNRRRIPASRLTEINKIQRRISAETASKLPRFCDTSAGFWVALQAEHDLEAAE